MLMTWNYRGSEQKQKEARKRKQRNMEKEKQTEGESVHTAKYASLHSTVGQKSI